MKIEKTIAEKYGPAMEITDQAEADAYFERCVDDAMERHGLDREEAESVERVNLGYFAGYYDSETRKRVERLYRCKHPVFGSIEENGAPDAETALNIGRLAGAGRVKSSDETLIADKLQSILDDIDEWETDLEADTFELIARIKNEAHDILSLGDTEAVK